MRISRHRAQVLVAQVGFFVGNRDRALAQAREFGLHLRRVDVAAEQLAVEPAGLAQFAIELGHAPLERGLGFAQLGELLLDLRMVRDESRGGAPAVRDARSSKLLRPASRSSRSSRNSLPRPALALVSSRLLALVLGDLVHLGLRLRIELRLLPAEQPELRLALREFAPRVAPSAAGCVAGPASGTAPEGLARSSSLIRLWRR